MARGLGKGLGAFFNDLENSDEQKVAEVDIKELRPNPYQPRKTFEKESIDELKESIKEHGILQPLIVRKSIKGYEIVVGERRFRAARDAGLQTVPVVVRELSEQQMMELALLENLQREDLTPIEEAEAYQLLMEKLKITQEQLAKRLGKSRPHIANHIRLLALPEPFRKMIAMGELSMGHGRALLGLKNKENLPPLAEKVINENLNVRQLEQLVTNLNENVSRETKKKPDSKKDVFIKERETFLRDRFGTAVNIKKGKKKGKIEIEFYSEDDLERILDMLNESNDQ
ncbi:ParB/RepB/Spo0J family partition protein [Bacillus marinisedimentorum]|uniref:ParB/RepB/Spo0J family partition protein n=1 Tax=Bacillus marinisedimentorum TaxID=1821260 RepID=UPI00087308AD|nr:ParB/RepB/Spo0J family partition protein [Bacillus marinisedimentorum]